MDGKGYIYWENQAFSTVNLPHGTITQTSCNFSPLLMFKFGSIGRCLASLEKSICEFSMVYKKWLLWCGLGPIITILACNKFNSTRFVQSIPDTLLFHARLVTCRSAKKWYLMRVCVTDCVPLTCAYVPKEHTVNCIKLTCRLVQDFVKRIN